VECVGCGALLRAALHLAGTVRPVVLIGVGAYLLESGLVRYLREPLRSGRGLERMERATAALFLKGIFRQEEGSGPEPHRIRRRRARQSRARRRSTRTE